MICTMSSVTNDIHAAFMHTDNEPFSESAPQNKDMILQSRDLFLRVLGMY